MELFLKNMPRNWSSEFLPGKIDFLPFSITTPTGTVTDPEYSWVQYSWGLTLWMDTRKLAQEANSGHRDTNEAFEYQKNNPSKYYQIIASSSDFQNLLNNEPPDPGPHLNVSYDFPVPMVQIMKCYEGWYGQGGCQEAGLPMFGPQSNWYRGQIYVGIGMTYFGDFNMGDMSEVTYNTIVDWFGIYNSGNWRSVSAPSSTNYYNADMSGNAPNKLQIVWDQSYLNDMETTKNQCQNYLNSLSAYNNWVQQVNTEWAKLLKANEEVVEPAKTTPTSSSSGSGSKSKKSSGGTHLTKESYMYLAVIGIALAVIIIGLLIK